MGKPTSDELKKMEVRITVSEVINSFYYLLSPGTEEVSSRSSGVRLFQCKDLLIEVRERILHPQS